MNKLIEFNASGGTVLVETSEMTGSPMRGAGMSQLTEKIGTSFEDTLSVIRPVANAAFAAIRELAATPETVEVDFSLKFEAHFGAILASASGEGSMSIKLTWKPK